MTSVLRTGALVLALTSLTTDMSAQSAADCVFSVNGKEYSIDRQWTHTSLEELFDPYLADDPAAYKSVSDFFVHDGYIYFDAQYDFTHDRKWEYATRPFVMYRYCPDTQTLDRFDVKVPQDLKQYMTKFPCDYFFVGKDTAGKPFLVPHEGSVGRQDYLHTETAVFPLTIEDDGTPVLEQPYIFKAVKYYGDIVEEPVVDGSLESGNFTVAYFSKNTNGYAQDNCSQWKDFITVKYENGELAEIKYAVESDFRKPCIQVVEPGMYLTSDKGHWFSEDENLESLQMLFLSVKTLKTRGDGKTYLTETSGCTYVDDVAYNNIFAGGASWFRVGDVDILFYVSARTGDSSIEDMYFDDWSVKRHTYTFASVNGYKMSSPQELHSYSGDEFGYYTSTDNLAVDRSHPVPVRDGVELYTMTGRNSLSKFKVTDKSTSAVDEISTVDTAPAYYTIDGQAVDAPSAAGIYIRLDHGRASKVIIR